MEMEKIYPSIETLMKVNRSINCPEEGCNSVFKTESNLNLHLTKTHKKGQLIMNKGNKAYFCPILGCNYNETAYFKQFKLLKQHFLKVHSEKSFICTLCKKGFPTQTSHDSHFEYCDVSFKCCDCEAFYSCYETLKTHSRRKNHRILEKAAYKTTVSTSNIPIKLVSEGGYRPILPKCIFTVSSNTTIERGSQTELHRPQKETQTVSNSRKPQFTVETQTVGDCFNANKKMDEPRRISTKTQTNAINSKTTSCNTSFNLNEFDFVNSIATQTFQPQNFDSIHTDTSDLVIYNFDNNFFNNCNMETQTDFNMFNEENLFNCCEDYSNMYTQTCENLLLNAIGLNDIQTQTMFDDVWKSVESQTIMSHSIKINSCGAEKELSHMETQTDFEFKQILEDINA